MAVFIWLIVITTAIWVGFDAKAIGVKKGQMKGLTDLSPTGWFFSVLLLWIIGFPLYLSKRSEYKRINGK